MSPQQTVAHYRILSKLGEGGMGAVYRATDTKLGREVAIKVLPDLFANDPDRLARFTREAQVLASLNHPNVAAIYGVEERAIVLELVEGETLAGPLSEEEALPLIQQLIEALEYAHEKGIVHRDLKPANIKITPEGRLKVLDFGLAKALASEPTTADPASSPTMTMRASMAGVIMGTAGYMSPEQARGQNVDKRADIWAFGVVVYEMLMGRALFQGETISDTLAAVLRHDPDISAVPPRFQRLLRLCLMRDPRQRLRDISGARLLLEEATTAAAPSPRSIIPWAIAMLLGLATILLAFLWLRRPIEEVHALRFTISPPDKATFDTSSLAVSPDGRRVAFIAEQEGTPRIWVRDLDAALARPLPGTEGVYPFGGAMFWSPDSRFLGFYAADKLKKVDVTGGPPLTLCDANIRGGSWSTRDIIVFGTQQGTGLMRVAAAGGSPVPLTELDASNGENTHRWPWFLPDGRHFLFFARTIEAEKRGIWVGDLDSKDRRRVISANSNAIYDPRGFLLFVRDGTLMAQPWDAARFKSTGNAFPVAEQVVFTPNNSLAHFSLSQTGVLAYYSGDSSGARLTWFDRTGKPFGTVGAPGQTYQPAISPRGDIVAADHAALRDGKQDIWLYDLVHGTDSRFTFDTGSDSFPVWSPDGRHIAYASNRTGKWGVYAKPASGSGEAKLLFEWSRLPVLSDWSRDGKFLIFSDQAGHTGTDIRVLPNPVGDPLPDPAARKPYTFLQTNANKWEARLSPDGRWLAYESDESQQYQIYVVSFPGKEAKFQISTQGGRHAKWSRDGKELFYLSPDRKVMAVNVRSNASFEYGKPKPLFDMPAVPAATWDISPDGKRFLIPVTASGAASNNLNVVVNWYAGVKK